LKRLGFGARLETRCQSWAAQQEIIGQSPSLHLISSYMRLPSQAVTWAAFYFSQQVRRTAFLARQGLDSICLDGVFSHSCSYGVSLARHGLYSTCLCRILASILAFSVSRTTLILAVTDCLPQGTCTSIVTPTKVGLRLLNRSHLFPFHIVVFIDAHRSMSASSNRTRSSLLSSITDDRD
jgi:hypothetical protein